MQVTRQTIRAFWESSKHLSRGLYLSAGDCLDDVCHDWDGDEEARDVVEDECGRGGVRGLEGAPHPLAKRPGHHAVPALLVVLIVGFNAMGFN